MRGGRGEGGFGTVGCGGEGLGIGGRFSRRR